MEKYVANVFYDRFPSWRRTLKRERRMHNSLLFL